MPNDNFPEVNALMPVVLQLLGDNQPHTRDEVIAYLCDKFNLTPQQRAQRTASNTLVIGNHLDWVRSSFTRAALITTPRKGVFQITPCGQYVLRKYLAELSVTFLNGFRCPQ